MLWAMGKIEFKNLEVALVDLNEGQVPGLPRNPRCWTYDDIQLLQESIQETPELLEARGVLVYPYNGRYVAVGGNMRLCAVRNLRQSEVACVVLPPDTPSDKLREIAIKDNGYFGEWDELLLKEDWEDVPFAKWGIKVFEQVTEEPEKPKMDTIPSGGHSFEVLFGTEEFEFVNNRLRDMGGRKETVLLSALGYYDS